MVYKSREDHKKLRSTFNSLSRKINTYTEITFYSVSVFPRYLNLTYACTEGLKNDLLRIPLHQMKNSWKDGIAQVHNLSFARKRIIFVSNLGKEGCFFQFITIKLFFIQDFWFWFLSNLRAEILELDCNVVVDLESMYNGGFFFNLV